MSAKYGVLSFGCIYAISQHLRARLESRILWITRTQHLRAVQIDVAWCALHYDKLSGVRLVC